MNDLSRRDLLRVSAGAALVAVPMVALVASPASAQSNSAANSAESDEVALADRQAIGAGPVMFCVHDAALGEVSILHGTSEVIVKDRQLVSRIMAAAGVRQEA